MQKATKQQWETAKKIAKEARVARVYMNTKEEWFTDKNRAELSDKKEDILEFDCNSEAVAEDDAKAKELAAQKKAEEVKLAAQKKAEEAKQKQLVKIGEAETIAAVKKLGKGYEQDADVTKAIEAKVQSLTVAK